MSNMVSPEKSLGSTDVDRNSDIRTIVRWRIHSHERAVFCNLFVLTTSPKRWSNPDCETGAGVPNRTNKDNILLLFRPLASSNVFS
jgi:hypothetical protein